MAVAVAVAEVVAVAVAEAVAVAVAVVEAEAEAWEGMAVRHPLYLSLSWTAISPHISTTAARAPTPRNPPTLTRPRRR